MPNLSKASLEKLNTCHPALQELVKEVIKHFDIAVLCGHRTQVEQEEAFRTGVSKARWGESKHNSFPSLAVDIAPYPIDWDDLGRFYYLGGFVIATAKQMGLDIRWGGDWDGDFEIKDQNFNDLPHFEITL